MDRPLSERRTSIPYAPDPADLKIAINRQICACPAEVAGGLVCIQVRIKSMAMMINLTGKYRHCLNIYHNKIIMEDF